MRQMQTNVAGVLTLVACLALASSPALAANVGRQRRVQTTATSTGPAQSAVFGVPLWHTTFNSNDEYFEAPIGRPLAAGQRAAFAQQQLLQQQQQQQQQQAKQLGAGVFAEEPQDASAAEATLAELDYSELTPTQLQQLLLLSTPAAQQVRLLGVPDEPRFFHFRHRDGFFPPNASMPADGVHNITTITINNNNLTNVLNRPAAAAAAARIVGAGLYRSPQMSQMPLMPLQYFETRQGQNQIQSQVQDLGLGLPYELIDLNAADLYSGGLALSNAAAGLGAFTGLNNFAGVNGLGGGGVPLVPVTLANNAVGYVPLNMRVFRQLAANANANANTEALPVREGEDEANPGSEQQTPEVEPEPEVQAVEEPAVSVPAEKLVTVGVGGRFPLFGQRLRQRQGVAVAGERYPMRNPLMAFAKNIRRVQYL